MERISYVRRARFLRIAAARKFGGRLFEVRHKTDAAPLAGQSERTKECSEAAGAAIGVNR